MAKPDDIAFNAMKDGGKKMDLFGTDFWYSDTTHVRDRYISIGEDDGWKDIDRQAKEYQKGGKMDLMGQKDVIMPIFSGKYDEKAGTNPKIGDISVNPKNRVMRQYNTRNDFFQPLGGGGGQDTPIWGDILDEGGNKTGTQVLLRPKFNARRVEEGNLSKLHKSMDDPQNKSLYLTQMNHINDLSNKLINMEDAELGWELQRPRVAAGQKGKYIYRDADGTQYYSPKSPFGESK